MSELLAPFNGAILRLDQFDDLVFKDELVGSGVGIRPAANIDVLRVHSPMAGTVIKTLPHAFIVANDTISVLVHIGIDTIGLYGDGFTVHIKEGQSVEAGELCYEVDAALVREHGLSLDTPVVVMDSPKGTYTTQQSGEHITQGAVLLTL